VPVAPLHFRGGLVHLIGIISPWNKNANYQSNTGGAFSEREVLSFYSVAEAGPNYSRALVSQRPSQFNPSLVGTVPPLSV
jgi:hypothetical protein